LGAERSLDHLYQRFTELMPKIRRPSLITLKNWSRWFAWQHKVEEMDEEANRRLYEEAVGAARGARVDILKLFKAVVLRFATQLKNDPEKEIDSYDIATFWKMARIEMGLPAEHTKSQHEIMPITKINIEPHDDEGDQLESDQETINRVKVPAGQRND